MTDQKITALTNYTNPDAATDVLPIVDVANGQTKKITRNSLLGITGAPIGTTDAQTLTNKVIGNTNTVTVKDTLFTLQDDSDTTKQAQFQLSGITTATTRTYTLPNRTDTLVDLGSSQTLTSKTLTSPTINTPTITNPTITVDTISEFTGANGVTIDGLNIKDGALNTINSVPNTAWNNTGAFGSSWAWTAFASGFAGFTGGSETVTARYTQLGKTVKVKIVVTLGATPSAVTNFTFNLPVTANSQNAINTAMCGSAVIKDANGGIFVAALYFNSTTAGIVRLVDTATANATISTPSTTTPMTWAISDIVSVAFEYEAA